MEHARYRLVSRARIVNELLRDRPGPREIQYKVALCGKKKKNTRVEKERETEELRKVARREGWRTIGLNYRR